MKKKPTEERKPTKSSLSLWQSLKRFCIIFVLGGSLVCTLGAAAIIAYYSERAKAYDLTKLGDMPERTIVMDAKGVILGRMHGENRIIVPLSEVSPWFVKALLAREDSRFYKHGGVDYLGVARAMVRNVKELRVVQGASTLTMQLARNSYPDLDDRSLNRKLVEIMLARRIEKACTKEQIIEHYVNRIFYGPGIYGVQRASQVYFGKHASQLSLSEAAMIAGIIRSPARFSPFRNYEGALKERDTVLKRMLELKMITPEEEIAAKYADIALHAQPLFQSQGGYALDTVRRDLDLILEQQEIEDGGLQVYTTLNKELQDAADEAVEKRLAAVEKQGGYAHPKKADFDKTWDGTQEVASTPYLQAALMMQDNTTGGILALVGGRDYRHSKYNRATMGERQIGSTVKPFVYAAAIASGFMPGTLINDAPIQPGEIEGASPGWNPQNSDGKFLGPTTLTDGIVKSRNTMTLRLGNYAGVDRVIDLLTNAGFAKPAERTPQIFIGNIGGNPRQLTSAISVFPNQGLRRRPFLIDRIVDKAGNVIYQTPVLESEVMTPSVAFLMRNILAQVLDRGTAATLRSEYGFKEPGGGKTGTTNDYKDAWFAGYTDRVSCGIWVGLDKPQTIVEGGYGGTLALPIWADVMKKAVALGYKTEVPKVSLPLSRVSLCRVSSQLATDGCAQAGTAYEDALPYDLVPQNFCSEHQGYHAPAPRPASHGRGRGLFDRIRSWFQ
ncbi:transglycosylase domain-containing protein [Prosthecobacter fluviatilis]|uniref:Transglycosylase domain-containing protein n=1 Tax=Prosthecobacter fluviatilis TaxID=445931 RepID=A0ABW0KJA2_9BACT